MSLMNSSEDLSGLGRPDLVYKAKLAEQAERCAFADLVHFFFFLTGNCFAWRGKGSGTESLFCPNALPAGVAGNALGHRARRAS